MRFVTIEEDYSQVTPLLLQFLTAISKQWSHFVVNYLVIHCLSCIFSARQEFFDYTCCSMYTLRSTLLSSSINTLKLDFCCALTIRFNQWMILKWLIRVYTLFDIAKIFYRDETAARPQADTNCSSARRNRGGRLQNRIVSNYRLASARQQPREICSSIETACNFSSPTLAVSRTSRGVVLPLALPYVAFIC